MNENIKRLDYMDAFRAFGIIFMIMGHIGFGQKFDFFIHAFHMPMFFFVSGFFFNHKSIKELSTLHFIIKKIKTLLIPYFVFGLFHFIIAFFVLKKNSIEYLYHLFWINNSGLPIAGALWFLTAIFFSNIIFFIIDRYISNKIIQVIIIVLISLAGNILPQYISLPFSLDAAFVGVGLMYLGNLIKRNNNKKFFYFLLNLKLIPLLLLCFLSCVLIFLNSYINMRNGEYSIIPLFWINALLAIITGINISKITIDVLHNSVLKSVLLEIGQNSIIFLCLNQITIALFSCTTMIEKTVCTLIVILILYVISKFITNTSLRIIIGKPIKFNELIIPDRK